MSPGDAAGGVVVPRRRGSDLAVGERLGRYFVVRKLATGGMAELYLARATGIEGFERLVALKRIRPELANDGEFVRMFLDEARLAALLQHPNIVQVFDVGVVDGEYFFAMEHIDGLSVRALIQHARRTAELVPLGHALAIAIAVAAALHHAHERRAPDGQPLLIVHRDVSPSNVLVSREGAVKLVDFGIAKAAGRSSVTRCGTVKGKAAYMSPEQCSGGAVDHRSDIFSLGVTLYELTTGAPLFTAENDVALAHQLCNQDAPPPSLRRGDYPPALEAIVLGALERDRERRVQTAEELRRALEDFAAAQGLTLLPTTLGQYVSERMGGPASEALVPASSQSAVAPEPEPRTASLSPGWEPPSVAEAKTLPYAPRRPRRTAALRRGALALGLAVAAAGLYAALSRSPQRAPELAGQPAPAPAPRPQSARVAPPAAPPSRIAARPLDAAAPSVSSAPARRSRRPAQVKRAAAPRRVQGAKRRTRARPAAPQPQPAVPPTNPSTGEDDQLWPH